MTRARKTLRCLAATVAAVYSRLLTASLAFALLLVVVSPAPSQSTTQVFETFDSYGQGTLITNQVPGVSFPASVQVFTPPAGRTASSPRALRNALDCNGTACTNGAYKLEMRFQRPARSVALRAGDVLVGCFEFDCPRARLVGYDASGNVIVDSGSASIPTGTQELPGGFSANINQPFSIDAQAFVITRAVLYVGQDDVHGELFGLPRPAQIDDLQVTMLDPGEVPPPPGGLPPAPMVTITDPMDRDVFLNPEVSVSGTVMSSGIAAFCVVVDNDASLPTPCNEGTTVRADGNFGAFRIRGLHTGTNRLTAWVLDSLGRTARDTIEVLVSPPGLDVSVEALEVTQAVQTKQLPSRTTANRIFVDAGVGPGPLTSYSGVPLAKNKKTVVRVFVRAMGLGTGRLRSLPVLLHGYVRVGSLGLFNLGSPLRPDSRPPVIVDGFDLAVARAAPDGAFTFTLPIEWQDQAGVSVGDRRFSDLLLAAQVAPPAMTTGFVECAACGSNNTLAVDGIFFTTQREVPVYPVSLASTEGGVTSRPAGQLADYFTEMTQVTPAPVRVRWPLAEIDISRPIIANRATDGTIPDGFAALDDIIDLIAEVTEDRGTELDGKVIGLLTTPGLGSGKGPGPIAATGSIGAKLDFVTHETYHTLGFKHASNACDAGGGTGWPPDERGRLQGVGLDTRYSSGGTGLYRPIAAEEAGVFDATPDAPAEVHDLMSYCSDESMGKTWISTKHWALGVQGFAPRGDIITGYEGGCCRLDPPSGFRARDALRVAAIVDPQGAARIVRVAPVEATPDASIAGAPFEMVLRDATGAEIVRTGVRPIALPGRVAPGQTDPGASLYVAATLPRGSEAVSAELVGNHQSLAARVRSFNAPQVRLLTPGAGTFVSADGRLTVSWIAFDADMDELSAKVEYSADGGRWRTIATGITGTQVELDGELLSRSDKGRVRVTVSDGFNTGSDTSAPFHVEGRGTGAVILSPPPGAELSGDGTTFLEGYGFDDTGAAVSADRLEWRSGGDILGHGEILTVPTYRIANTLTLVVTAPDGRTAERTVPVTVVPAPPLFTELDPRPVRGRARTFGLRIATTQPARLLVDGAGVIADVYDVSPASKNIQIRLDGKVDVRNVQLTLVAGGMVTVRTLAVPRG